MTMPTISLVEDLRPYRDRAAELTAAIVACEPGALDDGRAFSDELDERFVDPLTAEYEQIPLEVRAHDRRHGIQHVDAISELIVAFAGAWDSRLCTTSRAVSAATGSRCGRSRWTLPRCAIGRSSGRR